MTDEKKDGMPEREAFEIAFMEIHGNNRLAIRQEDGSYSTLYADQCWKIWQKARAKPVADDAGGDITGDTSDGYHTFNELYEHRHALFMAVAKAYPHLAWKSPRHDDDTMMEGWFIAGISTPEGHATYHLPVRLYEAFPAAELDRAPKWDGHTSDDVLKRIAALRQPAADNRGVDVERTLALIANKLEYGLWTKAKAADEIDKVLKILRTTPEDAKGDIVLNLGHLSLDDAQNHALRLSREQGKTINYLWKNIRCQAYAAPQPEHDKTGGEHGDVC